MLSAERYFHSALLQRFLGSYVAVIMHTVYLVISMCRRETFRWVSSGVDSFLLWGGSTYFCIGYSCGHGILDVKFMSIQKVPM
jgi:hypothetical protein